MLTREISRRRLWPGMILALALLASPALAARATRVTVHKATSYAERWSDHAAVSAVFD